MLLATFNSGLRDCERVSCFVAIVLDYSVFEVLASENNTCYSHLN